MTCRFGCELNDDNQLTIVIQTPSRTLRVPVSDRDARELATDLQMLLAERLKVDGL